MSSSTTNFPNHSGTRSFTFGEKLLVGILFSPNFYLRRSNQSRTTRLGRSIHNNFSKERGVLNLGKENGIDSRCENYFLICNSVEVRP